MHIPEGEIRAYLDKELNTARHEQVKTHLDSCPVCQALAAELSGRTCRVDAYLTTLEPGIPQAPQMADARDRLKARLALEDTPQPHKIWPTRWVKPGDTRSGSNKEIENMWQKLFTRKTRPVWALLVLIVLLTASMAFSPVRAIANSFLGLFRIQHISVIQVSPDALPSNLGRSSQLEAMMSQDVKHETFGEVQTVSSAEEASQLIGMPVRLPSDLQGQPVLQVQPASRVTFTLNSERIQAILNEIGRSDIQLPKGLDGTVVTIDIPAGLNAMYGDCSPGQGGDPDMPQPMSGRNCTTYVQIASPTISAPPGLDVEKIGEAYLQILGMSSEDASHFAKNIDWTTTFVVPLPSSGVDYQDVNVDGVTGTIVQNPGSGSYKSYDMLWIKDGVVYALHGQGVDATIARGLQVANSLK